MRLTHQKKKREKNKKIKKGKEGKGRVKGIWKGK